MTTFRGPDQGQAQQESQTALGMLRRLDEMRGNDNPVKRVCSFSPDAFWVERPERRMRIGAWSGFHIASRW
jgi:hypothetical protein